MVSTASAGGGRPAGRVGDHPGDHDRLHRRQRDRLGRGRGVGLGQHVVALVLVGVGQDQPARREHDDGEVAAYLVAVERRLVVHEERHDVLTRHRPHHAVGDDLGVVPGAVDGLLQTLHGPSLSRTRARRGCGCLRRARVPPREAGTTSARRHPRTSVVTSVTVRQRPVEPVGVTEHGPDQATAGEQGRGRSVHLLRVDRREPRGMVAQPRHVETAHQRGGPECPRGPTAWPRRARRCR